MAGTVVAVFEEHEAAEKAARTLVKAGVPFADISLVRKGAGGETGDIDVDQNHPDDDEEEFVSHGFREVAEHDVEQPIDSRSEIAPRVMTGVIAGLPLGALAVAASVIVPSFEAVVMTGAAVAMGAGALAGGLLGGVVGAMSAGGIPMDDARFYHTRVESGDTLIAVLAGKHNATVLQSMLERFGGHDIKFFSRLIDSMQSFES